MILAHSKNRVGRFERLQQNAPMNEYDRIADMIRHLDEAHTDQPTLDQLARKAGLSSSHFHRLFRTWASVTPKDFIQCLTQAHARELLLAGESVLNASLESGLSGPGRLHDLCVRLESATPGEIKAGGEGWTLSYGFAETPFGPALIAQNDRGICHLSFTDDSTYDESVEAMHRDWPRATLKRDDQRATENANAVFLRPESAETGSSLRAFVKGSSFQVRVWHALLRVPPGSLVTYGALARSLGQPTAARAVGSAVGSNCLAYLIPCHRVIRETAIVGDYRWGKTRKKAMIARESASVLT